MLFIEPQDEVVNERRITAERMKNLHPYVPGEQPQDREYIKLNANENPYPPSPQVIKAVKKALTFPKKLSLYPDSESEELREAIARMLNKTGGVLCRARLKGGRKDGSLAEVKPSQADKLPFKVTKDMIYAGNGSDEVLSFIFYAFFDNARSLVLPEHTYSFYPVYAGYYGISLDKVSLKADQTLDIEKMVRDAKNLDCGIIFANPNAPTSLSLSRAQIRSMLLQVPEDKVFVVDEAYADFGKESCVSLLSEFKNLIVVRTFSKSLCAAGMRLGYLVSSPQIVETVTTVKNSVNHFPIDFISQQAGTAICDDAGYYAVCAKKILKERYDFIRFLRKNGWEVNQSETNFVFAKKSGFSGKSVYKAIKKEGVLVRHFDIPGIEDWIRITIGTESQMLKLKRIIKKLFA